MTDLEKHVSQPGRAKLVKQVRAKIMNLKLITFISNLYLLLEELLEKVFLLTTGKEPVKKDFN